jgi:DnaJ-class molecular chaperone
VKKTVEIEEPAGTRKLSVAIPPGVRSGSVIRLRAKNSPTEELVLIVRVASHPFIAMQPRGIVVEVPVSVQEAVFGASITVPTLEDPVSIKIPPGTQSGQEVRLRERGVHHREGARGDIFYRILIAVPGSPEAVGLREKVGELEAYYGGGVRAGLPAALAG